MRSVESLLVCGLVLALAGCASRDGSQTAWQATTATLRSVSGGAQCAFGDGQTRRATPGMTLPEGATLQTRAGSAVDLQVNGYTSTVRVEADTTVTLKTMKASGPGNGADTETVLDLKVGTILGSVRKLSKGSRYEVETPRGVVRLRGTDFEVQVVPQANGLPKVTFTSVTGQLLCVANVKSNGQWVTVTKTLNSGQFWTPPESVSGFVNNASSLY